MSFTQNEHSFEPVHVRQVIVEEYKVQVRVQVDLSKRFITGVRMKHADVFIQSFKYLAQAFSYEGMVIND